MGQTDIIAALVGAATSILCAAISYGILKEKITHMEKELDAGKDKFVSYKHFDAIVEPIQIAIREIQTDIKKVLIILSTRRFVKESDME